MESIELEDGSREYCWKNTANDMELYQQLTNVKLLDRYWRNMALEGRYPTEPRPSPSPGMVQGTVEGLVWSEAIPAPEMKTFSSGAKSSVEKPRYDLIPQRAQELYAGRFAYGATRHGERNYRKGAADKVFINDRINHLLEHAMKFAESRKTSDLAAILCNASILADIGADTTRDGANGTEGA